MEEQIEAVEALGFWPRHRYLLLVTSSIGLSMILVIISMTLYFTSGAAQLDLSRPGYKVAAEQAQTSDTPPQEYSAYGAINSSSIEEFEKLFNEQSVKATEVDAFSGDPLNPDALEISDPKD